MTCHICKQGSTVVRCLTCTRPVCFSCRSVRHQCSMCIVQRQPATEEQKEQEEEAEVQAIYIDIGGEG